MTARLDQLKRLSVFIDGQLAGTLHNEDPLAFSYAPAWSGENRKPLHPAIPLAQDPITTPHVHAFFENLLPEGDQRKILSLRYHVSSVFGLLAVAGGDTAGALVLLPEGERPAPHSYEPTTWEQVDKLIHGDGNLAGLEDAHGDENSVPQTRVSISGAQRKLLLLIDKDGRPLLPLGASPSTHILKPDMARNDIKLFATAVNETIVMRTAALCGLPTAPVRYVPEVKACLVDRFDREPNEDGTLRRLWQADFCQLAGTPSTRKYEVDGGPSFKTCFDLLRQHSARPAVDQRNLLRWLFFNLCVGNHDSHAKNIAILATGEGLRLAPFYDMMCTRVYSGLGAGFAFQIGGEYAPGKLEKSHLEELAKSLEVGAHYVTKIAIDVADAVSASVPIAIKDVTPALGQAEIVLTERMAEKITSITKKMRVRSGNGN